MNIKLCKRMTNLMQIDNNPILGLFYQVIRFHMDNYTPPVHDPNDPSPDQDTRYLSGKISYICDHITYRTEKLDELIGDGTISNINPVRTIIDDGNLILSIKPSSTYIPGRGYARYATPSNIDYGFSTNCDTCIIALFAFPLLELTFDEYTTLLNDTTLMNRNHYDEIYASNKLLGFLYTDIDAEIVEGVQTPKEIVPEINNQIMIYPSDYGIDLTCDLITDTFSQDLFSEQRRNEINISEGLSANHWSRNQIQAGSYCNPWDPSNEEYNEGLIRRVSGDEYGRYTTANESKIARKSSVMMDLSGTFSA